MPGGSTGIPGGGGGRKDMSIVEDEGDERRAGRDRSPFATKINAPPEM